MSLFNWFSRKSVRDKTEVDEDSGSVQRDSRGRSSAPPRLAANPAHRGEDRRLKRHARREQLYGVIREAMTHAGVLSGSYKFKVLSLDQGGGRFLVMMDVEQNFDNQAERLADIEGKIVQTAKAHFEILVTAVYWRIAALDGLRGLKGQTHGLLQSASRYSGDKASLAAKKPAASPHDPIHDDEVAAFKQALAAASANTAVTIDASGKIRSGLHSYTLLTGFEDTELPESAVAPVLSTTQYGDLR